MEDRAEEPAGHCPGLIGWLNAKRDNEQTISSVFSPQREEDHISAGLDYRASVTFDFNTKNHLQNSEGLRCILWRIRQCTDRRYGEDGGSGCRSRKRGPR